MKAPIPGQVVAPAWTPRVGPGLPEVVGLYVVRSAVAGPTWTAAGLELLPVPGPKGGTT